MLASDLLSVGNGAILHYHIVSELEVHGLEMRRIRYLRHGDSRPDSAAIGNDERG
jgi:hypothetical protein